MLRKRADSLNRFASVRLLAITDAQKYGSPAEYLLPLLRGAPPGGLAILLREKECLPKQRLFWAQELLELTQKYNHHLLISDDLELVLELGADGLHCSRNYANLEAARLSLGSAWLSQGASLNEQSQLNPREERENDLLTARLLSPVWQNRKGRAALGRDNFYGFIQREQLQRSLGTKLPFYFSLGGANASYLKAAQAARPKLLWRAAAIASCQSVFEQTQWLEWLEATGDLI